MPDTDGIILGPEGALKIEGMGPTDDYTTRRPPKGLALYNKTDRTFRFTTSVSVKIVWAFAFEDLPETARDYMARLSCAPPNLLCDGAAVAGRAVLATPHRLTIGQGLGGHSTDARAGQAAEVLLLDMEADGLTETVNVLRAYMLSL